METKIIKGCHALIRLPRNSVDKERNFLIPEIRKDSPNFPISRSGHKFGENRTTLGPKMFGVGGLFMK